MQSVCVFDLNIEAVCKRRIAPVFRQWRKTLQLWANVFDLPSWRDRDPIAYLLLAAFTAIVVEPLVHGSVGTSVVALMTPVK